MNKKETIVILLFFILLVVTYFYKVFMGLIPIPADLLVGGYYPWLDYKWGYSVGVPVRNPAISDVISFAYPLKSLALDLVKQGHLPFWNPYILIGMPLLADWQAAVFYPLNILMILIGNLNGWTVMIILQPLLSLFFMFIFLRVFKLSTISSVFGAIVFAFGAYMQIFLEYNYLQGGSWLPLLLLSIEKYIQRKKNIWLILISFTVFIILSAGNFQISLFSLIISTLFFVFRSRYLKKEKVLYINFCIFLILGVGLISIQIVPTVELFLNSIRAVDSNIIQQNFGLLPLKQIITFMAPDFFGNPATFNSRAFLYHETLGYFGIIPLIFIIYLLTLKKMKKDFLSLFFAITFFVSLILLFDTPIGKLPFMLQIPLISTSYASRILFLLTLSSSVLAAIGMNELNIKDKLISRINLFFFLILGGLLIGLTFTAKYLNIDNQNIQVSLRNLILPTLLTGLSFVLFNTKFRFTFHLLIFLTLFDLFRFGWKYNPFIQRELIYPRTPIIDFLSQNKSHFRIEREKTEVLPPNSWMHYRLSSPAGYNPLALKSYAQFFNIYNGNSPNDGISRYLELGNYNSSIMDLLGAKYLVVAKRDKDKISSELKDISSSISSPKFKRVFEDKSLVVLENSQVMSRVLLYDKYEINRDYSLTLDKIYKGFDFRNKVILGEDLNFGNLELSVKDFSKIVSYEPNKIIIDTSVEKGVILVLTDINYPGWNAYINNQKTKIYLADGIFKAVYVPAGLSQVKFAFEPGSFYLGLGFSLFSAILMIILLGIKKVIYEKK